MRLHRSAPLLVLLSVCTVSNAGGGGAGDRKEGRLTLPTEWRVGSQYRYRAAWNREITKWSLPGGPPPSLEADQAGEVTIRVVKKSGSAYVLRWEPALPPVSGPPRARGDVDAAGIELLRHALSLPLELAFDPKSADRRLALRNEPAVRAELSRRVREFLRELPGGEYQDLGCGEPESPSGPCAPVAAEEGLVDGWRQHAAPLFNCSGLELNPRQAEAWSEPHPNAEIGAAVSIEHRREVVDFDPRSPRIRIRTVMQPNAKQWDEFFARELAKTGPSEKLADALSQSTFRFETACTMDRRSGWPVTIEQRATGSSKTYEGVGTIRFELIEDTDTKPSRRR